MILGLIHFNASNKMSFRKMAFAHTRKDGLAWVTLRLPSELKLAVGMIAWANGESISKACCTLLTTHPLVLQATALLNAKEAKTKRTQQQPQTQQDQTPTQNPTGDSNV